MVFSKNWCFCKKIIFLVSICIYSEILYICLGVIFFRKHFGGGHIFGGHLVFFIVLKTSNSTHYTHSRSIQSFLHRNRFEEGVVPPSTSQHFPSSADPDNLLCFSTNYFSEYSDLIYDTVKS